MNAKIIFYVTISQIYSSLWWYIFTQQKTPGETPLIMLPGIMSIIFAVAFIVWIYKNWEDK